MEEILEHEKMERKTTMHLDELILELEEKLTQVIGNLIWLIKPVGSDRNPKGTYIPKVGSTDYNKALGAIYYQYFYKSHKFVQKLKKELNKLDINNVDNRVKVWKYIWEKPDFGKNINGIKYKKEYISIHGKDSTRGNFDISNQKSQIILY